MSLRTLEGEIMVELRIVSKKRSLRLKDLMEWRTGKDSIKAQEGETLYWLPTLGVTCAVKVKP